MKQAVDTLRQRIRKCSKEFRETDDTSPSIFTSDKGFSRAYPIKDVETILNSFENQVSVLIYETTGEQLRDMAVSIEACHDEPDVCNFAERVEHYLRTHPTALTSH